MEIKHDNIYILYNTGGCPPPPSVCVCVRHKFYIQLALPISPEIMDGFWCSRCLNDRVEVPDMMRLFAGGATTPLVVKIWTKQLWVKIENSRDFDRDFALFRAKVWLWLFYNFISVMVLRFYTRDLKSFRARIKTWRRFSRILIWFWIGKINVTPSFLLEMTWNFLCTILKL